MEQDRVARLSEGQRQCLRLVYRHMETKEIARILGISPDGVAQRIKTAMRILGVYRRRDAARMLAEAEAAGSCPPRPGPLWDIAGAPQPPKIDASIAAGRPFHGAPTGNRLREGRIHFDAAFPPPELTLPLPLPRAGRRPKDVGWLARLAWIAAIAIGGALAFGALAAGVEALGRLFRD
jgi:DNA-binding CsgD family transcriptional regulator